MDKPINLNQILCNCSNQQEYVVSKEWKSQSLMEYNRNLRFRLPKLFSPSNWEICNSNRGKILIPINGATAIGHP